MFTVADAMAYLSNEATEAVPFATQRIDHLNEALDDVTDLDAPQSEFNVEYAGPAAGIAGKPNLAINLPTDCNIELNLVPDLGTGGEFTTELEDENPDTVKSDPFDTSLTDPRDPSDILADDEDEDEARYLTLQDLM